MLKEENKKGQIGIFVIVALVIVGGIVGYFLLRNTINISSTPAEFQEVYDYYGACIEESARQAIEIAGTQGGRVYVENYAPGSEYAPFSSELNFLGNPVPYWYYLSGNGVIKQQVPTKKDIEKDISRYINENALECDFENFYNRGMDVKVGTIQSAVTVSDMKVRVDVKSDLDVSNGEGSARKSSHVIELDSKLGKFYKIATEIYSAELEGSFLENYSADVLRLYAPVDGVELSCSPPIWKTREVIEEIKNGLEANIAAIKFDGNYYTLSDEKNKYFVVDKSVDESVSVMYSKSWPSKVEIYGDGISNEIMTAQPVGNQEGLGVMGFCYAPYHFVYDVQFPVMFQIYNNNELFQFPVVVIIDKNMPRNGIYNDIDDTSDLDIDPCEYNTQDLTVNLFDNTLSPANGNISYSCFNSICQLGESSEGVWSGKAPACVNGQLIVKGEGYAEKKQIVSTNSESNVDVILDREYDVELQLYSGGSIVDSKASSSLIGFTKEDGKTISIIYPETKTVKLSEGNYEVSVYVYGNSSITIPESTKTECTEVPRSGIFGLFGSTKEHCVEITIPETKIDSAILGGGKSESYLLASELEKGSAKISVQEFPAPTSLEQMGYNFGLLEGGSVDVEFS